MRIDNLPAPRVEEEGRDTEASEEMWSLIRLGKYLLTSQDKFLGTEHRQRLIELGAKLTYPTEAMSVGSIPPTFMYDQVPRMSCGPRLQ